MEVLRGKRNGAKLFIYQGYSYHLDKRRGQTFRCSGRRTRQCSGVLIQNGDTYILKNEHNHLPQPTQLNALKLKIKMRDFAIQSCMANKQIFDTLSRENQDAAVHLTYISMKSSLARAKQKRLPALPGNLHALEEILSTYEPLRAFYKGSVTSAAGEIALIFSTDILLAALSDSSEIYVDGTFSVLPRTPDIGQLYTIHIRYSDTGIGTVFVLCQNRTASLYKAIWAKMFEIVPNIRNNIKFIMSDYEAAARSSMKEMFPAANIQLCWFHFSQALQRKWHKLGLSSGLIDLLHMSQTLPLLPSEFFEEALNVLEAEAIKTSMASSAMFFVNYMRHTWLPRATEVTTYGFPARTNNIVESFNRTATIKLGKTHSNLWLFLENLSKLLTDQELDYGRLKLGHRIKRKHTHMARNRDRIIQEAQNDIINKKLPLKQFLRQFTRSVKQYDYPNVQLYKDNTEKEGHKLRELKVLLHKINVKL